MKNIEQHYAALGLRPGASLGEVRKAHRRFVDRRKKARTDDDALSQRVREERLDKVEESYRALVTFLACPDVSYNIPSIDSLRTESLIDSPTESVEKPKKEPLPLEPRFEATSMPKRPSVMVLMVLGLGALVLYFAFHTFAALILEYLGVSHDQAEFAFVVLLLLVTLVVRYRYFRDLWRSRTKTPSRGGDRSRLSKDGRDHGSETPEQDDDRYERPHVR